MKKLQKWSDLFWVIFTASLALGIYYQQDTRQFMSPGGVWSDKAGYYIYLPAVFFYDFDARKMPPDLDIKTGGGFSIDTTNNKIDTKYTYGVALMVSPFFGLAHLVSAIGGYDDEAGFSLIYMRMMLLAAVVYLTLGLWLLFRVLSERFSAFVSILSVLLLFMATNLCWYSLIDGLMSHVYSFFLFSLFVFSLNQYLNNGRFSAFAIMTTAFLLALLIRPTNVILLAGYLMFDISDIHEVKSRNRGLFRINKILFFVLAAALIFSPQLVYWKYLSGRWLHFSYRGEGFKNLWSPEIFNVLFSPVNGLIPFTPLVLLMLMGLVMMFFRKAANRWLVLLLFIFITMVCASWSMWYFGCSYGQRSYIEYFVFLAIPLAWFLQWVVSPGRGWLKSIFVFLLLFMIYANIRYVTAFYRYDRCWYGSTWDWGTYGRSWSKAGVIAPFSGIISYENDFENLAIFPGRKPSLIFTRSGQHSIRSDRERDPLVLYEASLYELEYPWPKFIDTQIFFLKPGKRKTGASLKFSAYSKEKEIFTDVIPLDSFLKQSSEWTPLAERFIIPDLYDTAMVIRLTLENPNRVPLFADDLALKFGYSWKRQAGP
jgi:hypothetical protein